MLKDKFSEEGSRVITDVLLLADLYGIESHGVQRLVRYVGAMDSGDIKAMQTKGLHGFLFIYNIM